MKAKWLIELDLFLDTEKEMIELIKKSGRTVKTVNNIPTDNGVLQNCRDSFNHDDCVIFYGSLNLGKKLNKVLPQLPGIYLNEKAFECTSYYPVFGNLLVHENYVMMPFGDLLRRKNFLFWLFSDSEPYNATEPPAFFIRPNSGMKPFTGTVITYDDFEKGIDFIDFYKIDPDLLVLVSGAKSFDKEWRFVIVNNKVISGSLYRDWSAPEELKSGLTTNDYVLLHSHSEALPCNDDKAHEFAQKCAGLYSPDTAWTMDVVKLASGEYRLLEIGSFSCAGLYGNDLKTVVEEVSLAAEAEWDEYYNSET